MRLFFVSSALITSFLCLQGLPTVLATTGCNSYGSFYDNWGCGIHYASIEWLHSKGFAEGEDPKSTHGNSRAFYGSRSINRAEFTKLVLLVAGYKDQLPACEEDPFPDVKKDEWFAPYICAAKARNIVNGFPDGMFHPSRDITYASAAKILVNAFDLNVPPVSEIWFQPYVVALSDLDALSPTIESFDQKISRGEMAEMLYRLGNDGELYFDNNISNPDAAGDVGTGYSPYGMEDDLGIYTWIPDQPFYFTKSTTTVQSTMPELHGYRFFHTVPVIHCGASGLWEHCKPQLIDWSIGLYVTDKSVSSSKEKTLLPNEIETLYFGGIPGECSTLGVEGEYVQYCYAQLKNGKTLIVERFFIDSSIAYIDAPGITPIEKSEAWFARIRKNMVGEGF